jgi:hypothetical protein
MFGRVSASQIASASTTSFSKSWEPQPAPTGVLVPGGAAHSITTGLPQRRKTGPLVRCFPFGFASTDPRAADDEMGDRIGHEASSKVL